MMVNLLTQFRNTQFSRKQLTCIRVVIVLALVGIVSNLGHAKDTLWNVTTFAGIAGTAGHADGTGTSAVFNQPGNITIDSSNNLYVTEWGNCDIRKITPGAVVTTFAGTVGSSGSTNGTGTAASFSTAVRGITCDSTSSNLYVADMGNGLIRKIDISTAAVTNFVNVNSAHAITVQDSTSAYMVDFMDAAIYKTSYTSPSAVVFAGSTSSSSQSPADNAGYVNGTGTDAKFYRPTGIIMSGANLYVSDYTNNCIRQITKSGAAVTTFAGSTTVGNTGGNADGTGTAATFNGPAGIAVDSSGTLYVTEEVNHLIRKITAAGVVTTIAGGGHVGGTASGSANGLGTAATFTDPRDLVVDSNGNIYVTDVGNHCIRCMTPNYIGSGTTDTVLTSADYGTFPINFAGGTMYVGANGLTLANNVVLASDANTINANHNWMVLSGIISGSGALIQSGVGTLALSGANTYTGTTTISAGTLKIGNGGTAGSIASTSIVNNAALAFDLSSAYTYAGTVSGSGALTQSGSSTLTLSSATYTGATTISAGGTLMGNIATSIGVAVAGGGIYDLVGTGRTVIDPSGAGTIQSSGGTSAALTITSQNGSTFAGTIASTISGLTIHGSGILTLSGSQSSGSFPISVSGSTGNGLILSGATNLTSGHITVGAGTSFQVTGKTIISNAITFG
ncbi:MAG: autotransporter-associated beta strand repeat-containing protein [Pseudomonadota bacterium]